MAPPFKYDNGPDPTPEPYIPPTIGGGNETDTTHPEVTRKTARKYEQREVLLPHIDDGPRAIAYGEQRLAGKLQFVHYLPSSDTLWLVVELCAGECDALLSVAFADGRPKPGTSVLNYWWYAGTAAGQVDLNLKAVLPSWNEAFAGTCYVVMQLKSFSKYWKAALPDFVWHMRTRKCLMPDTGLYVYSTNVWDQWYDFARWSEGKALGATRLDAASFTAARNADIAAGRKCDSHFLLLEECSPDDVIKTFRLMARAFWFWDATRYRAVADRPVTSVATYDDRHVSRTSVLDLDRSDIFERPNKITIWYTDIANGWQQKPMSLATSGVDAGTEDPIEEEYRLPHLHDPAQVKSLLTYILNARQFDVRVRERWMAVTADRQLGDVVTRVIEARGLTIPMRLLRRTKRPDNSFDVELFEHNDAKFAEFVLTEPTKIASTFPDPTAAPPNVDASGVTWTEEQYPNATGDWLPKGTLSFTPPANYPWVETFEVWASINGGPVRHWFDTTSAPAMTPALYETGTYSITIKTKNRITQEVSSGTTVAVSVQGVTGAVPEIVDAGGDTGTRYWSAPQVRSISRYGAASWTQSGLTSFSAANVNDGVLTTTCGISPAGAAWLRFDAGAGQTRSFRELTYYVSGTLVAAPWVEFSDDSATWTPLTTFAAREPFAAATGVTGRALGWPAAGAHRYWRVNFGGANTWTEFHFAEYLGEYAQVREYRVYDVRNGVKRLFLTVPAKARPSATTPLSVAPIMTSTTTDWKTGGQALSEVLLTVVNAAGVESAGVRSEYAVAWAAAGGQAAYVPQQQTTVTVANGVNASVSVPSGPGFVSLSGATAPFSIAGFSTTANAGALLMVCNSTAQVMTVLHESASAAAANMRIATATAFGVAVAPGGVVTFVYDGTAQRWRLFSTPVARVVDYTGTYGSIGVQGASGSFAGIRFLDSHQDQTLMVHATADMQGIYRADVGTWSWYFQNGTLMIGTVPWTNIGSKPSTLSGYGITDAAPLASPSFTGAPAAPTPATSDSSNTIATTQYVRNAIDTYGGSVTAVTAVSPNTYSNLATRGFWTGTSTPRGPAVNATTFTDSTVTVASITGAGSLRYLSLGRATSGNITLTVTVDGIAVISNATYYCSGALGTHFNIPVVGSINMAVDGTGATCLWPVFDETGLEFETSLVITAQVTGTAYVAHAHKLA